MKCSTYFIWEHYLHANTVSFFQLNSPQNRINVKFCILKYILYVHLHDLIWSKINVQLNLLYRVLIMLTTFSS